MENNKLNFLKQYGVDTDAGINNTMDFETYNEILLDFLNSFPGELNKVNSYRMNGDINNYVISVHALKSNCRTLGFMQMGEIFYQHEMAGKQNNIEFLDRLQININELMQVDDNYNNSYIIHGCLYKMIFKIENIK